MFVSTSVVPAQHCLANLRNGATLKTPSFRARKRESFGAAPRTTHIRARTHRGRRIMHSRAFFSFSKERRAFRKRPNPRRRPAPIAQRDENSLSQKCVYFGYVVLGVGVFQDSGCPEEYLCLCFITCWKLYAKTINYPNFRKKLHRFT